MNTLTARVAVALASLVVATGAAAQDIKIRLAHSLSTTEPAHLAAEFFAKNVAARTNGKVQIQVFPSEQLGSGKDVNEMIRQGANVMNITDPGYLSDFVPDIGVLNGPYLIKTTQRLRQAAGVRLVQGRREEARSRRLQADHGQWLLRPAPPDRRTSRCASPKTWPA